MSQSMTSSRQLFLRQLSSPSHRRQLLQTQVSAGSAHLAELAGGTTAECAAVACCCPCGLANLLILVMYKVPAGLCRRVIRHKRRKRLAKNGLLQPGRCKCSGRGFDGLSGVRFHPVGYECISEMNDMSHKAFAAAEDDDDVARLEKEMWDRFYSTGFWRSPSMREPPPNVLPSI